MGIRFLCPNGHKLNVKSFQAGKRGICPHCGARFTIPGESTLPDEGTPISEGVLPLPVVADAPGIPPQESTPTSEQRDPFLAAPDARWYVSPPGGGQFGPAHANLMKTWIAEGRVTADSLVWREGWDDWVEASTVLPQLASPETASFLPPPEPVETPDAPSITVAEPERTRGRAVKQPRGDAGRRRSSGDPTIKWVALLTALVVVLIIVFIWMVTRS
jgi:hypothetical protein